MFDPITLNDKLKVLVSRNFILTAY